MEVPGQLSTEIRWFGEGAVSFEIALETSERPAVERRRDIYLAAGSDDLGVKLRGGQLEIKHRLEHREPPGALGVLETWKKIISSGPWDVGLSLEEPLMSSGDPRLWVAVEKARLQIPLEWRDGALQPARKGYPAEALAAALELTEVRVGTRTAWTIGVEAVGAGHSVSEAVEAAAARAQATFPEAPLSSERSMGYPAWLRQHSSSLTANARMPR